MIYFLKRIGSIQQRFLSTLRKRPVFSPPPTAPMGGGDCVTPEAIAFCGLKRSTGPFARRPSTRGLRKFVVTLKNIQANFLLSAGIFLVF
jgi:hypothetical protein